MDNTVSTLDAARNLGGLYVLFLVFAPIANALAATALTGIKDLGRSARRLQSINEAQKRVEFWRSWLELLEKKTTFGNKNNQAMMEADLMKAAALLQLQLDPIPEPERTFQTSSAFRRYRRALPLWRRLLLQYRAPTPTAQRARSRFLWFVTADLLLGLVLWWGQPRYEDYDFEEPPLVQTTPENSSSDPTQDTPSLPSAPPTDGIPLVNGTGPAVTGRPPTGSSIYEYGPKTSQAPPAKGAANSGSSVYGPSSYNPAIPQTNGPDRTQPTSPRLPPKTARQPTQPENSNSYARPEQGSMSLNSMGTVPSFAPNGHTWGYNPYPSFVPKHPASEILRSSMGASMSFDIGFVSFSFSLANVLWCLASVPVFITWWRMKCAEVSPSAFREVRIAVKKHQQRRALIPH